MKKMTVLFAMALLLGFPLAAMSETTFSDSAKPDGEEVKGIVSQFRTSTNVLLIAEGTNSTYAAVSGHLNGDRRYGSSSGDSKLYWKSKVAGTGLTDTDKAEASDSSAFVDADGAAANEWAPL